MVGLQRQEVDVLLNDSLCLCQHLCLRNPEGGGRYGNGEVVNLYAVELLDADLDGIEEQPAVSL